MSEEKQSTKHIYEIIGYDLQRMKVSLDVDGTCGVIHLPKSWARKDVVVILLEEPEDERQE